MEKVILIVLPEAQSFVVLSTGPSFQLKKIRKQREKLAELNNYCGIKSKGLHQLLSVWPLSLYHWMLKPVEGDLLACYSNTLY